MTYQLQFVCLGLCVILASFLFLHRKQVQTIRLPPGPTGIPFFGNLLSIPTTFEWEQYHRWSQQYCSELIYLNVAGQSLIILDSIKAATELLKGRAKIYSSRPRMVMINEVMNCRFAFPFMNDDEIWRRRRCLMKDGLRITKSILESHQKRAISVLLCQLASSPHQGYDHLSHYCGSIILKIAYGLSIQPENDPYIRLVERGAHAVVAAAAPGAFLVNNLPMLQHLPAWLPGASFKQQAKEYMLAVDEMVNTPYAAARRDMHNGLGHGFVSESLKHIQAQDRRLPFDEDDVKSVAGTMYAAGSDTMFAAVASCVLGLLSNTFSQRKAHLELDNLLDSELTDSNGLAPGRADGDLTPHWIPTPSDLHRLPYIRAIVKEGLRWMEVAPLGIPHALKTDDVYQNYNLPAKSTVIPNIWVMLHNPTDYPNPFKFDPDRFTGPKPCPDPTAVAFGFGKRICPGRQLAISCISLAVAAILGNFEIKKAKDDDDDDDDDDEGDDGWKGWSQQHIKPHMR